MREDFDAFVPDLYMKMSLTWTRWLSTGLLLLFFLCCEVHARQIGTASRTNLASSAGAFSHRPVELAWGISDVQTPVGKLFNFTIPKDAFDGEILDIKVTEVGKPSLPEWLTFDGKTRELVGWPIQAKDIGVHYIAVTVLGAQDSSVQDVFSLDVTESDASAQCSSEAAQTILTLMLDVDWDGMSMPERISLLGRFSNYMDIQVADFKVSPVTGSSHSALYDSSALIAGPGNAKKVKHPGIKLSSVVGCDGNLNGNHNKELTTFVEEAAKDGSMARFTGVDVVGWHLTTSKPVPHQRFRRQQNFLSTMEPSPIAPTVLVHPGGGVHATPYLSATVAVVVPTRVVGEDPAGTGIIATGIHPTARFDVQVTPTGVVVDPSERTPGLYPTVPPPATPPPKPSKTKKPIKPATSRINEGYPMIAVKGKVFNFQIPKSQITDSLHRQLTVSLLEKSDKNSWLELLPQDNGGYKLRGLPLQVQKGLQDYHLDVSDGVTTFQIPFKIDVQEPSADVAPDNNEMGAILSQPYDEFDLSRRLSFVDTLQNYYQDPDSENIIIRSIQSGSTHITWTNETLSKRPCAEIGNVSERVLDKSGKINPDFEQHFDNAGFKVDKVSVKKLGPCADGAEAKKATDNDLYISTVVPAVVVSSLLLLACCIACILFRKRRRGSKDVSTDADHTIFVGKNKPVILAGEISDNNHTKGNNGASKKPAVLADERPPIPPPVYPGRSSPQTHVRDAPSHLTHHPHDHDHDHPSEQHPLLFMPSHPSSGDRDQRPKLQLVAQPPSSRDMR